MNPYALKFKLQSTVYPKKKYHDNERTNLDLNSTARKKAKDLIVSPAYMDESTLIIIKLELSFPLNSYSATSQVEEGAVIAESKRAIPPTKPPAKGPTPPKDAAPEEEEIVHVETEAEILRRTQHLALKPDILPVERAVFIFQYKNKEFLQSLQKALLEINLECLGIEGGNERDIRTRKLTDEEKAD